MSLVLKTALPPLVAPTAHVLILGTMPGAVSLERQEYYANPRNQFWRVMQELYGIPADAPYPVRIAGLEQKKIALWDVLESCERIGSLDSAIKNAIPNDFAGLLTDNPNLKVIAFNGKKASEWFERWVLLDLSAFQTYILPSTSPAATLTFVKKLVAWSVIRDF